VNLRPATRDDAEAILAVAVARDVADVGQPDWTLEHVRDELERGAEGLVVEDGGRAVAFALLNGPDARVAVHPDAEGHGIGTMLAAEVERRATGDEIRQEFMTANARAAELLGPRGYELDQRYWRMARDLDPAQEPEPDWPDGIEPRTFTRGRDERHAYEVVSEAMRGIPGTTERSFEDWSARALGEVLVPELSIVTDGGVLLAERDGYVGYIAVTRAQRGRGLGRALLQAAFAAFARAGEPQAHLWVNGGNETAIRFYERAGMRVEFGGDRWVKRLRP
jgi:mycothiol synthase